MPVTGPAGQLDAYGTSRTSRLAPGDGRFLVHADMHNHSHFSDGAGDPELAFASMRDSGLDAAALTDHALLASAFKDLLDVRVLTRLTGLDRAAWRRVSELADVSLSYNSIQQWDDDDRLEPLVDLSRRVWRTRAYGDMWSYMMVAEGVLDVAGEPDLKPWDIAALVPIVEEAGGRFTSLDGDPGPWHGSALASNGLVHDAVVEVIRRDS